MCVAFTTVIDNIFKVLNKKVFNFFTICAQAGSVRADSVVLAARIAQLDVAQFSRPSRSAGAQAGLAIAVGTAIQIATF